MKRKTRKKLFDAVKLGLIGLAGKAAMDKMSMPDVSDAKKMKATDMNKRRIPAFIKKRGVPGGNPLRPKIPKGMKKIPESEFFGIDAFGAGMGAKKCKMIKARGGKLARVKPTKLM